jgi:hypothetical protein
VPFINHYIENPTNHWPNSSAPEDSLDAEELPQEPLVAGARAKPGNFTREESGLANHSQVRILS